MARNFRQVSLFDLDEVNEVKEVVNTSIIYDTKIDDERQNILINYDLEQYVSDVGKIGLEKTWDYICQFVIENHDRLPDFLNVDNFGELYEIGLAVQDKNSKKKSGQYYTPDDVALVMSEWLNKCEGEAVCDVACGTGKLILTYLNLIGYEKARELISNKLLYLYDFDKVAIKVCHTILTIKYGFDISNLINVVYCDFLDKNVILPENCKVISNPPYALFDEIKNEWKCTDVLLDTREFYSSFMEKIFEQAKSTVIITPFSFISGKKFYSLRYKMCQIGKGFIVAFDNVPGNIFCGRKHGIFNTNTANSVRAAISVVTRDDEKGFRISPLIRFKNEQRKELLNTNILEALLPEKKQIINESNDSFMKIDKKLERLFELWTTKSDYCLNDFISKIQTNFLIDVPNTCRYFTTASSSKLKRTGSITSYIKDKEAYHFIYCLVNSSFAYWWWRIFDGGITYPVSLFQELPVPFNLLTKNDKEFFTQMYEKMVEEEKKCVVTKVNAGVEQENIKFPEYYRKEINKKILAILGIETDEDLFMSVHANKFLGV